MKNILSNLLKFILFAGVGVTILYFVYQSQQASYLLKCQSEGIAADQCSLLDKIISDFKSANYWWILAVYAAFTFSNISRATRWGMLVTQLGTKPRLVNTFLTVIIGYFANLGLPRMGEIIRGGTLARYEKINVEKVMGTIVVDRMLDLICMASVMALAFVLEFDTLVNFIQSNQKNGDPGASIWQNTMVQIILGGGLLLGLVVLLFRKKIMQTGLYARILKILIGFAEGLKTIWKLDRPWLFIFHSLNIWVMYFLMTYLCFFAFAPTAHLGLSAGLMVFVFGALGIVIPSPGGMGTYHWLAIQALSLYAINSEDAFSFANILFFSVQIIYNVTVGALAFPLLAWLNRDYHPTPVNINIYDERMDANPV